MQKREVKSRSFLIHPVPELFQFQKMQRIRIRFFHAISPNPFFVQSGQIALPNVESTLILCSRIEEYLPSWSFHSWPPNIWWQIGHGAQKYPKMPAYNLFKNLCFIITHRTRRYFKVSLLLSPSPYPHSTRVPVRS